MQFSKEWLLGEIEQGREFKYLFFWGHQPSRSGEITSSCFSQWWDQNPFSKDGVLFISAEHWMMSKKALLFEDLEIYSQILVAKTPAEAKKMGRAIKNFDNEIWEAHRFEIVKEGNLLKFAQHPELKDFLLKTSNRVLVEASPVDNIWGIGLEADNKNACNPEKWNGLNLLGFALMETRFELLQKD